MSKHSLIPVAPTPVAPTSGLRLALGACLVTALLGSSTGAALAQGAAEPATPRASHGGKVEWQPPRPVAAEADPVNVRAQAETVDGIVVVVTLDGASVTLDSVTPARVPRRQARLARQGLDASVAVKATALANGQIVTTTTLPDPIFNASEGGGLVRTERRQVSLVLAAERAIDTVQIEAPATGASATLDVRAAYAPYCRSSKGNPDTEQGGRWCPRGDNITLQ